MHASWHAFIRDYPAQLDSLRVVNRDAAYTNGHNLDAIGRLAIASRARKAVEIGTAWGHTAVALARVLPEAEVVTLGITREQVADRNSINREILAELDQGSYIRRQPDEIRSRITAVTLTPEPRDSLANRVVMAPFQFAYIDGEHSWQCVAEDTKAILAQIDDGGIIVWDDYGTAKEVQRYIDTLNGRTVGRITAIQKTRIAFVKLEEGILEELREAAELL